MNGSNFKTISTGILLASLLVGCTPFEKTVDTFRDDRMTTGCRMTGSNVDTNLGAASIFGGVNGELASTSCVCSGNLPDGFKFKHNGVNGTECSYGHD